jgi:uncharacterized protein (DUF58 family)
MLAALSALYDTPRRDAQPGQGADLDGALVRLERIQARRGQIVVISDWLDTSGWERSLSRLAWRHQVIAAHVTDPRELELPPVGMLSVVDTETGQHLHVQTNSEVLRRRYAAAAQERDRRIRRSILESGAEHLDLSTDRDWLVDVARFVGRRRRVRLPARTGPHPAFAAAAAPAPVAAPIPERVR